MHVAIKELPDSIRAVLASVDYNRADIEIRTVDSIELGDGAAGDGHQAFTTLVNLETGAVQTVRGSFGGQNMFDRSNPVDNDRGRYPIPPNGLIIKGQRGGGHPVWATIYVSAGLVTRMLPSHSSETLPQVELDALAIYDGIVSAYRREYLTRHKVTPAVLDSLVDRGLLKRNKAGATSITTAGKNACNGHRVV